MTILNVSFRTKNHSDVCVCVQKITMFQLTTIATESIDTIEPPN